MSDNAADGSPRTLGDSRVTMYKECTQAVSDAHGTLDVGIILQWMDIAACLSAERHCQTNAVTLVHIGSFGPVSYPPPRQRPHR